MTYSKDSSEPEVNICFWKASNNVLGISIRCGYCLLLTFCLGLVITSISLPNSNLDETETTDNQLFNYTSSMRLESRLLQKNETKYVPSACWISDCTIECVNAKHIYEEVFQVLQASVCRDNITLKLDSQRFPNLVLTNRWKPANRLIKSLIIQNCQFIHIRNEAFNSFDFTATEMVTLLGVNLKTLSNGVLLGFAKLQSLILEGRISRVDRCFFQPVQSSLMRLTLRGKLTISGKDNIFGISYMSNLSALDLSDNFITGTLSRSFFRALPALKYLMLSNSMISSISANAFKDIFNRLQVLDLSNNHLKTLDVRSIEQILTAGTVTIYLLGNEWICECHLKPLITLYAKYEHRFGDVPYCKGPVSLYGVLLTNVKFDRNCIAFPLHHIKTDVLVDTSSTTEMSVQNKSVLFKMACLSVMGVQDTPNEESYEEENDGYGPVEYFLFSPPCHDFELNLLQNNSVQVVVQYADEPINIIWFSEAQENFIHTVNNITFDYNCEMYSDPFLLAENLEENCTYTFCLVPRGTFSITPFNCLPIHIPSKAKLEPNVWISHDEKGLTLGIIFLILMSSLVFGGVVAYFGIKAYPDILEGSNHVFVVKKSIKKACYVSTITEGEYAIHKNSLRNKKNITKVQLNSATSLLSEPIYKEDEKVKEIYSQEVEDYYEMPCIYNKPHNCQQKCIFNKCVVTPTSPPPLPKRNSDSTLYASSSELISIVPYPQMNL